MSTKKWRELGMWWEVLASIAEGEGMTAGKMGILMGTTRTTAQRKLRELVSMGRAKEIFYVAKNNLAAVKYEAS